MNEREPIRGYFICLGQDGWFYLNLDYITDFIVDAGGETKLSLADGAEGTVTMKKEHTIDFLDALREYRETKDERKNRKPKHRAV